MATVEHSKRQNSTLFLIDGMAIAYRSYFAFIQRPLVNSRGENTSAIYGFVTFLNKILEDENPDYIAVVFDTHKPTFRHTTYKEYKATRQKMPEDMLSQLGTLKEVVRAYNIPVLELDGYEADDIMGTLAKRAEKENVETFLVTSDKDFMQLVSDKTKIYKPGKGGNEVEIVGVKGVLEKFGVPPHMVIDVLGLVGDTSDNVPGVHGVGEKTAIPLIVEYGSIEGVYKNIESIPQKGLKQKLESNKDKAFLSKQLVTIDTDVPVKLDFHSLKADEKDTETLIRLFENLEFKSLARKLRDTSEMKNDADAVISFVPQEELSDITQDEHQYITATTEKGLAEVIKLLKKSKEFVFDTETTSRDAFRARLVGISLSVQPREAFYIALSSTSPGQDTDLFGNPMDETVEEKDGLPLATVLNHLRPLMEDKTKRKIGHNLKYDMLILFQHGIRVEGELFDTMIASYVMRADGRHDLDEVAREYLKYKKISFEDIAGTGKDQKDIEDVSLTTLSDYSCEDADMTFRLYEILKKKLNEEQMIHLCNNIEFPLVSVLTRMEEVGVGIDVDYLAGMQKDLQRQLDNLTREIHDMAGEPFNVNSTQQLAEILFTKFKLRKVRKTKTGFSTDVGVLEELRNEHPIVEKLLDYRQLAKLQSTYVEALPKLIHPRTGRVHTSFNQTVAATGRLSSSDPNLQNIPIRTEIGRSIRKAFIPGHSGRMIMSADYSQIELRVMAHISGDEGLAEAFRNKEDVHATTAAKIFGVALQDVTRDMRRKAKEVNFGIMYGSGPFGLATRLEITQTEAKDIITRYFERFPKVKQYIGDTIESARKKGYVQTLLGRRRYLAEINSRNQNIRGNAERQAINMPIQGTAADLIKLAMVHIDNDIRTSKLESAMLLQVHDELVFEIRKEEEQEMRKFVERDMREALELSVPLEVEIGVGKNWLEAH
ncbi:MAG: DNA polymerase I [Ignavibacteriales bacterium]|nr:DNA polymerase I [Ignavibacteriales bacterium]